MTDLYSLNGAVPAALPRIIRVPEGSRMRNLSGASITPAAITAAGYTGPYTPTSFNPATEVRTWDGENLQYVVSSRPVAARKADKIDAIKDKVFGRDGLIAAGFTYSIPGGSPLDPHTYGIGETDQANMSSIGGLFALGVTDAHGGVWPTLAGGDVEMTQEEATRLFTAAAAYKLGILRNARELMAATRAASNVTEFNAVDINSGWPTNGS